MGVNPVKRIKHEADAMVNRYENRLALQADLIAMAGAKLMAIRDIVKERRHDDIEAWDRVAKVVAGTRDEVDRSQQAEWLADAQQSAIPAMTEEQIISAYKAAFELGDGKGLPPVAVEFAKLLGVRVL